MRSVDVAIIGAGPAGLSAAIRTRWVKSYRSVPCSVAVYDPAPAGGLARIRSTRLTGPSWHLANRKLLPHLLDDVRELDIPLVPERVARVTTAGPYFTLHSVAPLCRARAVVMCTGLRMLSNEAEYFGRGLSLAYNGFDHIPKLLQDLVDQYTPSRILIVGNARTANLRDVLDAVVPRDRCVLVLDEKPSHALRDVFQGYEIVFGAVSGFTGEGRVAGARVMDADGRVSDIACDAAFIDYCAFEVRPSLDLEIERLNRDDNGFPVVDRYCQTNVPGLFAAGDVTGMYAMAMKAFSEGAIAGFGAYRRVFRQKFGYDPPLFAYAGTDAPLAPDACDYPELAGDVRIEPLYAPEKFGELWRKVAGEALEETEDMTYAGLCGRFGDVRAREIVYALLDAKAITVQPPEGATTDGDPESCSSRR